MSRPFISEKIFAFAHRSLLSTATALLFLGAMCFSCEQQAAESSESSEPAASENLVKGRNPVIWADVPDVSMIRVGDNYYMSSTTMHMSPGVPVMKSNNLVNWKLVNYAYDTLADIDALALRNGQKSYGRGSWASCLRYHEGKFYLSTFSGTTNKTYIFVTEDIENGPWETISFAPSYHDHSIFFDDDGKIYMIWGGGELRMVELREDLSGVKEGTERVLIENASAPSGSDIMLPAEGSQLFKVNGKYYLYNISWPRNDMRTVIVHRADQITGPYEGKVVLKDRGIAQGGLVDTPDGEWYSYLFRDYGAVGRIPYLAPTKWVDGWPVIGMDGAVPDTLNIMGAPQDLSGIVASDEFDREEGEADLPLEWQWNHNPLNDYWSLDQRPGYLRLINDRVDTSFLRTRNTLTQRTYGPVSSASVALDVSQLKNGDVAGLGALQLNYGYVGVEKKEDDLRIVMVNGTGGEFEEIESIDLENETVYFKISMDFRDLTDKAYFYYSLDGESWERIGNELQMRYTLPHFMGYRFALFSYATKEPGGIADFDWFRTSSKI